ncbi:hypothetical protein [Pseudonocardia sp.]|uniref:hypothetical protein n=1 Tax=Pseudonocardia sp. TaxID=60912 RepID=UPI003D0AFC87
MLSDCQRKTRRQVQRPPRRGRLEPTARLDVAYLALDASTVARLPVLGVVLLTGIAS